MLILLLQPKSKKPKVNKFAENLILNKKITDINGHNLFIRLMVLEPVVMMMLFQ